MSGSTPDTRASSLATSLVAVLVLAKVLGLVHRELPLTIWLPSVLFWDDVAVGLVFWVAARWLMPRVLLSAAYWTVVTWAALNVPVVRTLSSALTPNMLRAAGGALSDSVVSYVTPGNVVSAIAVWAVAALLVRLRWPGGIRRSLVVAMIALAVPGPLMEARAGTRGLDRNALATLVRAALPRVPASAAVPGSGWRTSLTTSPVTPDLSSLRGAAAGRNVIIVVLESTGAQYLRNYGAPDDPMPFLTALSKRAVQFDGYAAYPESVKGLFALLCSRHPAVDVSVFVHAEASCDPLAGLLGGNGYQSGLFHSGRFDYLGMDAIVGRQRFDVREDAGVIGGDRESSFGIDESFTVERMLEWIDARDADRPFLLIYLPIAGHHPYVSPGPQVFTGTGQLAAYKNALRHADVSVAMLVDGIETRGLDDSTALLVLGDHGQAFGQHDGNVGHTLFIFEENVHVPLLLAIPGVTDQPRRSTRVASVVDVAPTVLDLLGFAVPDSYEGVSLLDRGQTTVFFATDYALAWAGLRDGCWKYLLELEARRSSLFDVCRDPAERHDMAPAHPQQVGGFEVRVLSWAARTRRGLLGWQSRAGVRAAKP